MHSVGESVANRQPHCGVLRHHDSAGTINIIRSRQYQSRKNALQCRVILTLCLFPIKLHTPFLPSIVSKRSLDLFLSGSSTRYTHVHTFTFTAATGRHIVSAMALSHRTYPSSISAMSSRLGLSPKCVQLVMVWFRSHVAAPHIQLLLSR